MSDAHVTVNGSPTDLTDLADLVRIAGEHGAALAELREVGDFGCAVPLPPGWSLTTLDVRSFETHPRRLNYIEQVQQLVGVESFTAYVNAHAATESRSYIVDQFGRGVAVLRGDTVAMRTVLDDHPEATGDRETDGDRSPGRQAHRAELVLRPTASARRWGDALGASVLSQDEFLDLVVDGMTDITAPDGAVLEGLVRNLHAIRTSEVESVRRTGGSGTINLTSSVDLAAGESGDRVPFPELISVRFVPFAQHADETLSLPVKVTPSLAGKHVVFDLSAPALDDALALIISRIVDQVREGTGIATHWVP